ncbi:putative cyclic di-GMP phosphodiesterase YliE [Pseudovibrio axinellae]|uniref:Putative cyclic di-GMP phosphodiesterase YliE n=1 Tax=Pseudovibrio axinellae TaxID=989403 RepID=A0A165YC79_9HYPH|nr:EAL domain-containing protein [Pseudovibrio axinellae]KZL18708.1 putative cyclic di-GMP phosphodiesterase YliE [Pseudovibrio axinellae]SEP95930.1 cyclic-di-GMP phosphodiesterase, flagellum assembly factor TipF [Pseudovibrio axinellae]
MTRLANISILFSISAIAASFGIVMVHLFARPVGEAITVSFTAMCTMIFIHFMLTRSQEKSAVSDAVNRLEERLTVIDDDVGNLEGRLAGVEHNIPRRTREEIDPLFAEVEVIGSLVKQMAEAMADMEGRIEDQGVAIEDQRAKQAMLQPQPAQRLASPQTMNEPASDLASQAAAAFATGAAKPATRAQEPYADLRSPEVKRPAPRLHHPNAALAEEIRASIEAGRVDLYLQPIVTLPQRRVRYYEALTRLRKANGDTLEPIEFLQEAERTGQMAAIDNILLFRSLQILKRLATRNREAGLFCNLSTSTLVDENFFPSFLEFVRANDTYSDLLIFEFSQADVAVMSALEYESLAALADLGFRFSVDRITDLRMDFRALADRGFRFAKLHASRLLLQEEDLAKSNIHPADFGSLLQRYGIELIVDHVESEGAVLELLEMDIRCAQGFLFSPPRPVRADVLQGAPNPRPLKKEAS